MVQRNLLCHFLVVASFGLKSLLFWVIHFRVPAYQVFYWCRSNLHQDDERSRLIPMGLSFWNVKSASLNYKLIVSIITRINCLRSSGIFYEGSKPKDRVTWAGVSLAASPKRWFLWYHFRAKSIRNAKHRICAKHWSLDFLLKPEVLQIRGWSLIQPSGVFGSDVDHEFISGRMKYK